MLQNNKEQIVCYHEHDSLLDHKEEEALSEEDRKAAWAEYEAEKKVGKEGKNSHIHMRAWYGISSSSKIKGTHIQHLPLVSIILQIIDIKVQGEPREAPLWFVKICELVLDLHSPFITESKQMTAPHSQLTNPPPLLWLSFWPTIRLLSSYTSHWEVCLSNLSASYWKYVGPQRVWDSCLC